MQAGAPCPPDVKGRFTSHPAPERANYDFFDVQLYTPSNERLRPCEESHDPATPRTWRKRIYCVTPDTPFELRYTLRRDPGTQRWGGRVFVNAGGGQLDDTAYESAAAPAEPTHDFWFGAGAWQFVDTGFYEGNGTSRRFVVGKSAFAAAEGDSGMDDGKRRAAAAQLGSIRVQFTQAQVTEVEQPLRQVGAQHVAPLLPFCGDATARERKAQEFSCVVAPGARIVEDHDSTTAVLSPDTVFEYRIGFVHYALLSSSNLRSFGGLPLSLFAEMPGVRRRLVELALNDLQGVNRPSDTTAAAMEIDVYDSNPAIAVSDVVHHISRLVSPAASYFTCVGSFRPDRCVP